MKKTETAPKEVTLEDLLEAGAHFGHTKSTWHPKMAPFIFTTRENVHIIDLEQTLNHLKAAQEFAAKLAAENKKILFLGTKRQVKDPIKKAAQKADQPFVTERWLGGTITNFDTIHRQIKKLLDLEAGLKEGKFDKYTKREQLKIKEEVQKLNRSFGGIKMLTKLPDALFIIDINEEQTAVKEATKLGIPIIGTADTNADPTSIQYPIPINDDAIKSVELVANAIADAAVKGAKSAPKKSAQPKPKPAAKSAARPAAKATAKTDPSKPTPTKAAPPTKK